MEPIRPSLWCFGPQKGGFWQGFERRDLEGDVRHERRLETESIRPSPGGVLTL